MFQATVDFYGDQILVIQKEDGTHYVALRPICEALGVSFTMQRAKVQKDGRFNCDVIITVGGDGKQREMLCVPISKLNGWLYSINPNRVKAEIRDRLVAYQAECSEVLYRHFMPRGAVDLSPVMEGITGLATSIEQLEASLGAKLEARFQDEIEELRGALQLLLTGKEEEEIRKLIKEVKEKTKMDGRAIVGHVRKTLGLAGVYYTPNAKQIKNVLRNLLGKGVFGSVKAEDKEP